MAAFVSLCIAEPDPTAKLPAQPYTPAPPYHPPTLLHGYTPRPPGYGSGYGVAPAYPPPQHHGSPDYGSPPKCATHDDKLPYAVAYCLEDEVNFFQDSFHYYKTISKAEIRIKFNCYIFFMSFTGISSI